MLPYQVLARRYRPQKFLDVTGQEAVVTTLKNAIRLDKIGHAYIFSGPRGSGKTTLARLFAKSLNCINRNSDCEPCDNCPSCKEITVGQSLDVIEIDGASNRGIDDVRQINETVTYAASSGRFKIYIIDEVHMLTKEAFNALLKTLEEPPEKAKFFFATTEPHKILPTILSRCQRFDLHRIPLPQIIAKLERISQDLNRPVEPAALHLIANHAEGSLRDAESLLDQLFCFSEEVISEHAVRQTLGLNPQECFFALDQAFSEVNLLYAFDLVEQLSLEGKDLGHFFEQLIEHYRKLNLLKIIKEKALSADFSARYVQSGSLYTSAQVLYLLDYLLQAEVQFQKSIVPRVFLEATLLHIIRSKNRIPVEVLVRRLSELENHFLEKNGALPQLELEEKPTPLPTMPSEEPKKAAPLSLKPVPFDPYSPPKIAAPLEPVLGPQPKPSEPPSAKHPSHYDTLMRFAAIELEGKLKI